jgi:hypothetical protein
MGIIAIISTYLLLHSSVFLSLIKGNQIMKNNITSYHDRKKQSEINIALKHINSDTTHNKMEKKKSRHENTKNYKNKKDSIMDKNDKNNKYYKNEPSLLLTPNKLKKGLLIIPGLGRDNRLHIVQRNIRVLVSSGILLQKSKKEDIERKEYNGENNLTGNKEYENIWDCVIYIYTKKPNEIDILNDSFWNKTGELTYIENFCEIVLNPGKLFTQNLHLVQPITVQYSYEYVFILLDDCRLMPTRQSNFSTDIISNNNNIDNNNNNNGQKHKRGERHKNKDLFDLHKILRIMKSNNLTVASPMVRKYTYTYFYFILIYCL